MAKKFICWSLSSNKDGGKVNGGPIGTPTLFRTVSSPTADGFLFPRIGCSQPHPKLQSLLSQERAKLRTSNLADTFTGSIRTKVN